MKNEAQDLQYKARMMGALANSIRLGVLNHLLDGPCNVGDLVTRFGQDQTKISKHLAILRRVGLVRCEVDGRCRVYSLADRPAVQRILDCLNKLCPEEN
jgi:DNA-binding transcriptional ArsR family regulator